MKVFGVAGPGSGELIDALVERLDGRVAVVRDTAADGGSLEVARDATTYERAEGGWRASGLEGGLPEVLDRLATEHAYAVLEGIEDGVPTVALGDAAAEEVLVRAGEPAAMDLDALVAAVDELEPHETLASLVERVKRSPAADRAGAIATFTGRVRERDGADDAPTAYLEFERYADVADERLATIADDLESREGVHEVALHHRTGVVEAGEDIVFVVVLAGHREEAFDAARDGIDRLKAEVPIFKREVTADETFWVHEQ